ncbi:MAG: M23 family metallopeptidase [Oligoflexales bacterium]|nr:M23 family metallopeptidase [Oligoflexales bacterium]
MLSRIILMSLFCALFQQKLFAYNVLFNCPADRWKVVYYDGFAIWDDDAIKTVVSSPLAYGFDCFKNEGNSEFLKFNISNKKTIKPFSLSFAYAEDNYTAFFSRTITIHESWEYIFELGEIDDGVEIMVNGQSLTKIYMPLADDGKIKLRQFLPTGTHNITIKHLERSHTASLDFKFYKNPHYVPHLEHNPGAGIGEYGLLPYTGPVNWRICCGRLHSRGSEWAGNDYLRPEGSLLVAPFDGTVAKAGVASMGGGMGVKDSWGNTYMYLTSSDGKYWMLLMHGNYSLSAGQSFRKGERIGTTASIGFSSEPHDHISLKVNGVSVDIENYR